MRDNRILRTVLLLGALVLVAAGCANSSTDLTTTSDSTRVSATAQTDSTRVSATAQTVGVDDVVADTLDGLESQAALAGVAVESNDVAIAVSGQDVAAIAPVEATEMNFSEPGVIGTMSLSLDSLIDCGGLTSGLYTMRLAEESRLVAREDLAAGQNEVLVEFVNENGVVVLTESFAHEVQRMDATRVRNRAVAEAISPPVELSFHEVRSSALSGLILGVHVKSHHSLFGWEWWEWNVTEFD